MSNITLVGVPCTANILPVRGGFEVRFSGQAYHVASITGNVWRSDPNNNVPSNIVATSDRRHLLLFNQEWSAIERLFTCSGVSFLTEEIEGEILTFGRHIVDSETFVCIDFPWDPLFLRWNWSNRAPGFYKSHDALVEVDATHTRIIRNLDGVTKDIILSHEDHSCLPLRPDCAYTIEELVQGVPESNVSYFPFERVEYP